MENRFTEVMSKSTNKKLLEILRKKDDYDPEAVIAAENELKKRELRDLLISDEANSDDFFYKLKNSSNEELLDIYENKYNQYSKAEFDYLYKELIKRNIEPAVWYFTNGEEKFGPYKIAKFKELVNQDKFNEYDYVWRKGLSNWIIADKVEGLINKDLIGPPSIKKKKPTWIEEPKNTKERTTGILMAAIILFITVPLWISIALAQAGVSLVMESNGMGILAIYNILMTFATIAIGIGILKLKKWGYNWGLGSAILNTFYFGNEFLDSEVLFFGLLTSIELIVGILLFINRKQFKEEKITKEIAYI